MCGSWPRSGDLLPWLRLVHLTLRLLRRLSGPLAVAFAIAGCDVEFEDRAPRPRGEVGAEVFRVLCMNLAAQAFPNDLTGEIFSASCSGLADDPELDAMPEAEAQQRAYLRYRALLSERPRLVPALEAALGPEAYRPDELRDFLAEMVPLYDPPEQLPAVTRAAARLLA